MSLPDRNNPYNFNEYLAWRDSVDFYTDDPFIQKVLRCYADEDYKVADEEAREISKKVSFVWKNMADAIAWPEKRPYMMHYDGHHNRIDRIVRPQETEQMEREIFAEALFSKQKSPWIKLIKMYLIYQNGEACIACPITCTEGLVEILERYADTPPLKKILEHCRDGNEAGFGIGAQFISEIQGGSDIPANVLEAVFEDGGWRLYGNKFFCSATHADYALVTAKPAGSEIVALFTVPSWLPGNKEKEIRNGYTIDRIKWKMGTSELTTAEISYNGALAYPVGPLDRGVANVVGIVLTYSRLTVGISSAAFMTRAVREVKQYVEFRNAFGLKIGQFPLVAGQLGSIDHAAKRSTAGAFKLYQEFLNLEGGLKGGIISNEPEVLRRKRFKIRELIMLQKIVSAWDCTDVVRRAMSLLGGHGVMEDFSCLPRLYRDSAVNELWEGPRNVLLTQIHRDFQRASSWYPAAECVQDMLAGADSDIVNKLAAEVSELISYPSLFNLDEQTIQICQRWDRVCQDLYHVYQDRAMGEVLTS